MTNAIVVKRKPLGPKAFRLKDIIAGEPFIDTGDHLYMKINDERYFSFSNLVFHDTPRSVFHPNVVFAGVTYVKITNLNMEVEEIYG